MHTAAREDSATLSVGDDLDTITTSVAVVPSDDDDDPTNSADPNPTNPNPVDPNPFNPNPIDPPQQCAAKNKSGGTSGVCNDDDDSENSEENPDVRRQLTCPVRRQLS